MKVFVKRLEDQVFGYLDSHAYQLLRISIGFIYLIFGVLKFFPSLSPAEQLASDTICLITFDVLSGVSACMTLAVIETVIGAMLVFNIWPRGIILITMWHMFCTFLPLLLLPSYAFNSDPFSLSIVGQYIIKNVVILSSLIVLYKNERQKAKRKLSLD